MKLKDIDDWDHFKGDFKSRPKKEESKETKDHCRDVYNYVYANINSMYGKFGNQSSNLNQMHKMYNSFYIDMLLYGSATVKVSVDDPAPEPTCDHDPIDVGFAKVKMVCRKCDKDL